MLKGRQTLRQIHIWLGWIIGIPILLWVVSGLVMVIRPIETVRGEGLSGDPKPIALSSPLVPPRIRNASVVQHDAPRTYGAAKGLAFGVAPLPAVGMGVLTACLGGIVRDVLAGEPSILMRAELYVTAAALSSALMVGLLLLGLPGPIAGAVAALSDFTLRAGAIWNGWALPAYRR